jgi:fumarate hydratase class II
MLPVIAYNLLPSLELLSISSPNLATQALRGLHVNKEQLEDALAGNLILVTAPKRVIGYEKGAAIAKQAFAQGRPSSDVAAQMMDLRREELMRLLDPKALTQGDVSGGR